MMASETEVDVEGLLSATQSTDGSFFKRVESITFRVLELMLSDTGPKSSRREARSNVIALVLFLVDWAQLTAIFVSAETGWTFSWPFLDVIRQFSLLRILGIDTSTVAAFVVLWMIALAIMLGTLANAAYVAWQVRSGFTGSLFPVRTLRSAATVLLTAGYVPLVEMVSEPLSCERIQLRAIRSGTTQECWGVLHAPMFAFALPTLIVFIAFAFTMRSVYFSDAPLSQAIMAKPIARNEFFDIVVRTAVVLLFLFLARSNPTLVLWLSNVMYMMLTLQALAHLPYFKLTMTQFRVATYVSLVWVASGSCLIQGLRGASADESLIENVAFYWLLLTPLCLVLGAFLAWWRQRFMERKGLSIAAFHVAQQLEIEAEEALLNEPNASIDGDVSSTGPAPDDDGKGTPTYGDRGPSLILPVQRHGPSQAAATRDFTAVRGDASGKVPGSRTTTSAATLKPRSVMRRVPSGRAGADWSVAEDHSDSPQAAAGSKARAEATVGARPTATAAVAHVAGLNAAQHRKSFTREAEDVTELLASTPRSIRDQQRGFSALQEDQDTDARVSKDDSTPAGGGRMRRLSSRASARMLDGAAKIDREGGAKAGFVGLLETEDELHAASASADADVKRKQPGAGESSGSRRRGSKRASTNSSTGGAEGIEAAGVAETMTPANGKAPTGISAQVEELLLAAAARASKNVGTAGSGSRGAKPGPQRRASMPIEHASVVPGSGRSRSHVEPESIASDFVAALRSELGHAAPNARHRRGSTAATSRRGSVAALRGAASSRGEAVAWNSSGAGAGTVSDADVPRALSAAQSRRLQAPPPATDKRAKHILGITDADDEDPELDELIGSGPNPRSLESQSSHFWSSDTDVELFVRALLARPTQRRLKYARAVLDEALTVFPDSVFVRLTFTTYLFSRSTTYADVVLAMRLLGEAASMPASLDLRFAVFSKLNAVLNARRRLVLGEGQPGSKQDALDLVEFKRGVRTADECHIEAVKLMHQFWSSLSHGGSDGVTMRGAPISAVLGEMSHAADTAEKNYLHVLEKWPSSTTVQRAYGLFLINVRHDKEMGKAFLAMSEDRDDDLVSGSASQAKSGASGARSMARSTRSVGSILSGEALKRKRLKIGSAASKRFVHSLRDVASMRTGFRAGLFGLLIIIIGMYVLAGTLFSTVRKTVSTMNGAGLRRKLAQSSLYVVRGMRLAAQGNDNATFAALAAHGIAEMELLHTTTGNLFFDGPQPADIFRQWNQPVIPIHVWGSSPPPGHMQTIMLGLLESSFLTIANVVRVCKLDMADLQGDWPAQAASYNYSNLTSASDPFYRIPEYRFVMENEPEMLRQLEYAADTYQAADRFTATWTNWVMIVCVVLRFAILLVLALWVVRPAIDAIRWQKLHIRDLILMLPQPLAKHLSKRARVVDRALGKVSTASKGLLDEIDPTTKLYQTLASTTFLTTMPDLREGGRSRKRHQRQLPAGGNDLTSIVDSSPGGAHSSSTGGRRLDAIEEQAAPAAGKRSESGSGSDSDDDKDEGDAGWLGGGGAAKALPPMFGSGATGGGSVPSKQQLHSSSAPSPQPRAGRGGLEVMPRSGMAPHRTGGGIQGQAVAGKQQLARVSSGRHRQVKPAQMPSRVVPSGRGGGIMAMGELRSDDAGRDAGQRDSKHAVVLAQAGPETSISMFDSSMLGDDTDLLEDVHDADELAVLLRKREEDASMTAMRARNAAGVTASRSMVSEAATGPAVSGPQDEDMDSIAESGPGRATPAPDSALDEMLQGSTLPALAAGSSGQPSGSEHAADGTHGGAHSGPASRSATAGEDPVSPIAQAGTVIVVGQSSGGRHAPQSALRGKAGTAFPLSDSTVSGAAKPGTAASGAAAGTSRLTLHSSSTQALKAQSSGARRPSGALQSARSAASSGGSRTPARSCSRWCGCCRASRYADARRRSSTSKALQLASDDEAAAEALSQLSVCTNPVLRAIALRTAAVFTILVVLMAATTIVFSSVIGNGGMLAARLNNAGRRRYLARATLNQVRELVLADGQYDTLPSLVTRVQATLAFYEKVHRGLKLGDEDLGLPPQDPSSSNGIALNQLYYGDAGSGFDITATDTLGLTDYSQLGVEPLLQLFWQTARNLLRVYQDPAAPRPPRTLAGLRSLPEFERLWQMERGDLGKKVGSAVGIFSNNDAAMVDDLEVQAFIVLSVEIVILAVAYLIVYESMSSALATEHLRATEISGLIPDIIRKAHPALDRAFSTKPGSGAASRISSGRG